MKTRFALLLAIAFLSAGAEQAPSHETRVLIGLAARLDAAAESNEQYAVFFPNQADLFSARAEAIRGAAQMLRMEVAAPGRFSDVDP